MKFSQYKNFQDFLDRTGMNITEGLEFLKNELDRLENKTV